MAEGGISVKSEAGPSGLRSWLKGSTLVSLIFLAACCALSVWVYIDMMQLVGSRSESAFRGEPRVDLQGMSEAKELASITDEFLSMKQIGDMVVQTALLAESSSRHPVVKLAEVFPEETFTTYATISEDDIPQELELDPPTVTVIAVMIQKNDRIAMINVEGEEYAAVVREGAVFSSGTATITRIDEKSVTFRWMENLYTVGIQ